MGLSDPSTGPVGYDGAAGRLHVRELIESEQAVRKDAPFPERVETDLVDLTEVPLAALRTCMADALAASMSRIMIQVERPRANLGGGGPPGRVD